MRTPALALLALTLAFSFSAEARNCTRGIPCGNSCISASKTCRISGATSTTDSYRSYVAPPAAGAGAAPLSAPGGPITGSMTGTEVLYARDDVNTFDQPAQSGEVNGTLKKGARVIAYQVFGAHWVRIPPEPAASQRWVRRDALQSTPQ